MNLRAMRNTLKIVRDLTKIFPEGCKTGNELDWVFKDNCPCCIAKPIECLSNYDYELKYPASHHLRFGVVDIQLCDYHYKELARQMRQVKCDEQCD